MEKNKIRYLISVISVLASALIYFAYMSISGSSNGNFLAGVFTSTFSTLILFSIIYFILERNSIFINNEENNSIAGVQQISLPQETLQLLEDIHSKQANPSVISFYNCWSDVDWRKELKQSKKIEIVVTYWSRWVAEYMDELVFMLNNGGSISVVLSSPLDDDSVSQVQKMYPEHTTETMREKIFLTTSRLKSTYQKARVTSDDFEVFYYPERMNYAAIKFDDKRLFLGVYEHFREHKVASPAMLLDLTKSQHLYDFWERQFKEFSKRSERVSLDD